MRVGGWEIWQKRNDRIDTAIGCIAILHKAIQSPDKKLYICIVYIYYRENMTKLVSLSNVAYATLLKMKGKNMSFSDVIMKVVGNGGPRHDFLKFAGSLKAHSKELEKFTAEIEADRKRNIEKV